MVPLVIAIVLFSIIFVVIKFTTIRRLTGPAEPSLADEITLQPLPLSVELPPTTQCQPSVPNTVRVPPSYPEPSPESQGVTNMSLEDDSAQL